jgi:hypothetical protein
LKINVRRQYTAGPNVFKTNTNLAYDSNPVKKCIAMLSLAKFSTENIGWTGVWVIIFANVGLITCSVFSTILSTV